uniref:N-alpha-acetyltransferase 30 (inferred by orthology to a human protein) n=1 Tax=Strongyloides venezuelensis TaxID=75913 RepID=A0A0K0FTR2_STRVS
MASTEVNLSDRMKILSLDTKDGEEYKYISNFSEKILIEVQNIVSKYLSEPYSIYTYRYFLIKWPELCIACMKGNKLIGAIVCKEEIIENGRKEGYIGMLAVEPNYRGQGIGSKLVEKAIEKMKENGCDEVTLETEVTNEGALALYTRFGFIKLQKLFRYYLNGVDAFRLKLFLTNPLKSGN